MFKKCVVASAIVINSMMLSFAFEIIASPNLHVRTYVCTNAFVHDFAINYVLNGLYSTGPSYSLGLSIRSFMAYSSPLRFLLWTGTSLRWRKEREEERTSSSQWHIHRHGEGLVQEAYCDPFTEVSQCSILISFNVQ